MSEGEADRSRAKPIATIEQTSTVEFFALGIMIGKYESFRLAVVEDADPERMAFVADWGWGGCLIGRVGLGSYYGVH